MSAIKLTKFTDARTRLKELLDAANDGRAATVERQGRSTALVDQDRFLRFLRTLNAGRVQLVADEDGWLAYVTDTPLAGEGNTATQATDDLIESLREYTTDWVERLRHAPNHDSNWGLVATPTNTG